MSPATAATPIEDGRALFERLETWRERSRPRLEWCADDVGVVAGFYCGAARFGHPLCYVHSTMTALWPPVGVGIAPLDAEVAVYGRYGRVRAFMRTRRGPAA